MVNSFRKRALARAVIGASMALSAASQQVSAQNEDMIEEVIVFAQKKTYSSNEVTESMKLQQSSITSVNALIDNLPGVSVQEGDSYGFDDWSTTIAVRGFQTNLDEQQIGTTIDGIPNGNSGYGGGSKANRYVDPANLSGVTVSQGTADIASRSLEALGGTIDFRTDDPTEEQRVRGEMTVGDHDAQRYYVRVDTGTMGGNTRLWLSASSQEASDWINGAAENTRDHYAGKLIADFDGWRVTSYASFDDIHEDNYQRLFSEADWQENDQWDRLTDEWTGIPYIDQSYRRAWSTLRENTLGYIRLDLEPQDNLKVSGNVYYHTNEGRGDWVPQYIIDLVPNNGAAEVELQPGFTQNGGGPIGLIRFVDPSGVALSPEPGCQSSITFPYGGAGPEYDPACYPRNAIPVQSYRTTNYEKDRTGATIDADWTLDLGAAENTLRGGVWYEDGTRKETRTWQRIIDTRVGYEFDKREYWTQYDREYPQEVFKWYLEDSISVGGVTVSLGWKTFNVEVEREDNFGESPNVSLDSDSDDLWSGGVVWETPVDGLELFAGYAENFKSISDDILERPSSDLDNIEPETAENSEIGLRWLTDRLAVTAVYYNIKFDNRIIFLSPESGAGPDYIIGTNGTYFNAGGVDSDGYELTATLSLSDAWSAYAAYSYSDSTYTGTGDPGVDASVGIIPGNTVTGIPEDQFVAAIDWSRGMVSAGLTAKYTGERYINVANSWQADSYTTVDAQLSLMGDQALGSLSAWRFTVVVNNLLDETYLGGISGGGAWIGAPRTVSASLVVDI